MRTALRNKQFGQLRHMSQGLALNYFTGVGRHFDLSSTLTGSFPDYAVKNNSQAGKGSLLIELDASIRARLFSCRYYVTPIFQAGVGGSYYKGYWGGFIPLGIGLQAEIIPETFLIANAQYRMGIGDKGSHHFFYSIGLAGTIGKKKSPARAVPLPPTPMPIPPLDADGDGIVDSADHCPFQKGLVVFHGCPDLDGDSIPDKDDHCPHEKGLLKYQGCPIPDTDGDGIHDEADKCPQLRGLAAYQGCPPPDADNDGVPNDQDKCPELAGTTGNQGCPEVRDDIRRKINVAAQHIFFGTGSATLLQKSFKSLDEVIKVMTDDPLIKIDIEGHTDNIGTAVSNLLLSQRRAMAVRTYFINKGIAVERLSASGFGEDKPVADNNTPNGRTANRRVVLNLRYQ
ncbi:OmpA family protein [Paraflavitalea sp. CAU 1676]|uniref:OmpA family protein n=1 Tax=Paraflavitalea sp. CAU 1676 TaxID=3032598 RepID=UPI0023DBBEFD|nr:OmpA family protein [Paraflavitalea sp. CAU 1676]MDF2188420.1 OmpA family protein [Paraflavitalea sp. CAU 1676]